MNLSAFRQELLSATSADGVLETASRWIARSPADRFAIWGVVAESAPVLDSRIAVEICRSGVAADRLLDNPAANAGVIEAAVSYLVRDINSVSASQLRSFARRGRIEAHSPIVRQMQQKVRESPSRTADVVAILCRIPDLPGHFWEEWVERVQSPEVWNEMARVRQAPVELYRALLASSGGSSDLLRLLGHLEEVRQVPDLRARLLEAAREEIPALLVELAGDAEAEELRHSFQCALQSFGPVVAAQVLERARPEALRGIDRDMVRPLLESPNSAVRLIAIRAFAILGGESTRWIPFGRGRRRGR